MKRLDLKQIGVQELTTVEVKEVEGGRVPWWSYLIAPGSAYIVDKFLEGYENYQC